VNERVKEHLEKENLYPGFFINRIPRHISLDFKRLAKDEHCNDYGLTLKTLVDVYNEKKMLFQLLKDKIEELNEKLGETDE